MLKLQDGMYNEESLFTMLHGDGYAVLFMATRIAEGTANITITVGRDREDAFYQYDLLMADTPTISGTGSLLPMLHAKQFLLNECEQWAKEVGISMLRVSGWDPKRQSAYKRLIKDGYKLSSFGAVLRKAL